ncbi:MAG TPA: hypothetical protein VIR16_09055 [Candidatus Limnocylindrales bacterium]
MATGRSTCGASGQPAPSVTAAPAPSGWTYLPWYDPDLELAVPADWVPNTTFRAWSPDPSTPADVAAGAKWWNEKVEAGVVRMQANSSDPDRATMGVLVTVESGDGSLEAFVSRALAEYSYSKELGRHPLQSAVGPCDVVDSSIRLSSYSSLARDSMCRLADGRSLLVEVTETASSDASPGPDATSLAQLADQIMSTLRPHQ